jgi:hypothetical protein
MASLRAGLASSSWHPTLTRAWRLSPEHSGAERYDEWRRNTLVNALDGLRQFADTESQLLEVDAVLASSDAEQITDRLVAGRFDLVLFAMNADGARAFAPQVRRLQRARSVFIDSSPRPGLARDWRDGIRLVTEAPAQLAGAWRAHAARAQETRHADVVSVVAGEKTPEAIRGLQFRQGVTRAAAGEGSGPLRTRCSIRRPASGPRTDRRWLDLVFAHSGRCGMGALAVARRAACSDQRRWGHEPAGNVLGRSSGLGQCRLRAAAAFADGNSLPAMSRSARWLQRRADMSPTPPAGIGSGCPPVSDSSPGRPGYARP